MALKLSYGSVLETRSRVLTLLTNIRKTRSIKVLDIGGTTFGWSGPVVDTIVDFNANKSEGFALSYDICEENSWDQLRSYVDTNGRFDYVICTHTLEDLYNPFLTLKNISKIAKSGILTMPSIWTELSHVESTSFLGYSHHRWIFDWDDDENCMLVAPKLECLRTLLPGGVNYLDQGLNEVIYEFSGAFSFRPFMNNYLGPSTSDILENYRRLINNKLNQLGNIKPYSNVYSEKL